MSRCTIGIDIGSTTSKGILFDQESHDVLHVEVDTTRPVVEGLPQGHYEESPEPLRDAAYGIIKKLASYASTNGHEITAICFTGQMHGGLLVDDTLRPLSNFVTWQDKRGDELTDGITLAESIRSKISNTERESIGTDIHTGFLGVTAAWWKSCGMLPAKARIVGIYDWIASTLCSKLATDPSSIAAWGLYNIRDKRISDAAVKACGLEASQLPEVIATGSSVGYITTAIAHELGLPENTQVISGMGDTQASYIGSGCKRDEMLLNFGTGSQLMIESDRFARFPGTDTRYLSSDSYLIVAPTLAGGKAYSILADFFIDVLAAFDVYVNDRNSIYERMNELARSSSEGVKFTPHFLGSRTHGESLRAATTGLDPSNFRASTLSRALLEGMVEEVQEAYAVLPESLRTHTGIVASGNGMRRNAALRSVAELAFGLPLRLSEFEEEAALGAALVAARAVN